MPVENQSMAACLLRNLSQSLKSTSVQTERLFGGFGLRVASLEDPAAKDRELGKVSGLGGGWREGG